MDLASIDQLEAEIIDIQRQLVHGNEQHKEENRRFERNLSELCLGIIDVIDLIEQLQKNGGEESAETASLFLRKIKKRLQALLARQGVEECELGPSMDGQLSLIKVTATRPAADKADGTILEVIRKAYRSQEKLLRPAEVISCRNAELRDSRGQANPELRE